MINDDDIPGLNMYRARREGAVAHPDDIYIHCGCEKCDERYKKQMDAYNDSLVKNAQPA